LWRVWARDDHSPESDEPMERTFEGYVMIKEFYRDDGAFFLLGRLLDEFQTKMEGFSQAEKMAFIVGFMTALRENTQMRQRFMAEDCFVSFTKEKTKKGLRMNNFELRSR